MTSESSSLYRKNIAEKLLRKKEEDSSCFCEFPVLVALLQRGDSDPQHWMVRCISYQPLLRTHSLSHLPP